jgi:hypothetical protein
MSEWPPYEGFMEVFLESDAIQSAEDVEELWCEIQGLAAKALEKTIIVRFDNA